MFQDVITAVGAFGPRPCGRGPSFLYICLQLFTQPRAKLLQNALDGSFRSFRPGGDCLYIVTFNT